MEKIAPPLFGTLTGFLLAGHMGLPRWAFIVAVSISLLFGILASMGREGDRRVTPRNAVFNAGALWVVACAGTFRLELGLEIGAIFALSVGLLGSRALEVVERAGLSGIDWLLRKLGDPTKAAVTHEELASALGEQADKTQAAISEQAVERKREQGHE